MLAGKLDLPFSPSFDIMNRILRKKHSLEVSRNSYLKLEERILNALQFEMHSVYPTLFLERFLRVLDLDRPEHAYSQKVGSLARQLCLYMLENNRFLEYKPS